MDRLIPTLIVVAILAIAITLMTLSWRTRKRRQSGLVPTVIPPESLGEEYGTFETFYVATTVAGDPLERIAVRGLGFRARSFVTIAEAGMLIPIGGQPDIFVPAADLRDAGTATWTIDRVVEPDGLVAVGWILGDIAIDSYFRASEPQEFLGALTRLLSSSKESE